MRLGVSLKKGQAVVALDEVSGNWWQDLWS